MRVKELNNGITILASNQSDCLSGYYNNYEISYKGVSCAFLMTMYELDELEELQYVIVLKEKGTQNHYRLVNVFADATSYSMNASWCSLLDAMKWLSRYVTGKSSIKGYSFYELKAQNDAALDWIASYMPAKRSAINKAVRERVYKKCDGHCAYCGKEITIDEMQVDHVVSHYRHKGKDEITNYLPSCRDCNGLKSDYDLEEFRNVLIPNCAKHNVFQDKSRAARICKAYKINMFKKPKIVFYFERMKKDGNE